MGLPVGAHPLVSSYIDSTWAAYISFTRRVRGQMDVASFMAAMTPVATLAVLPMAIAHGGLTDVSSTGWKYLLALTVMTGVVDTKAP